MSVAVRLFDPRSAPLDPDGEPTIAEIVDAFLADQAAELGAKSLADRTRVCREFAERFGRSTTATIRPSLVKAWILERRGWRKASTRLGVLIILKRLFNWALNDRMTASANPLRGISLPGGTPRRPTSEAELQAMLRHSSPTFRRFLIFLRTTGARPGEGSAVEWEWVDWDHRAVFIPKDRHKTGKKTGKPRLIALPTPAVKLLEWLKRRELIATGPIFRNSRGAAWTRNSLSGRLAAVRAAADLPNEVTLHGLRHRFGTVGSKHAGMKETSLALGHKQVSTTEHFYCHMDEDLAGLVEAAELAAGRFGVNRGER